MVALASVLIVVVLSLLVTRVATIALSLTGLPTEIARFQARSALSGVGFTTSEAESVVGHPVRRRIVLILMLLGSAGVVTVIATLLLSFVNADRSEALTRLGILLGGLMVVLYLSRNERVSRALSRLIARGLARWTDLDTRDYAELLHLGGGFGVTEVAVVEDGPLAGRTIAELRLREEGIAVLGLQPHDAAYVGAPALDTRLRPGDVVIAYGPTDRICEIGSSPPEGMRSGG